MAWSIGGVGRQTRDAAEEAARRAGLTLEDWLEAAIADQAAGQGARPEESAMEDGWLDAVAGRLERISQRKSQSGEPRPPDAQDSSDSAIERFEKRLARAEARAARAFESVAHILESATTTRDGERQALVEAVRSLEAIKGKWSAPAQTGEAGDGSPQRSVAQPDADGQSEITRESAGSQPSPRRDLAHTPDSAPPKPRIDFKAAVSQIAMRRQELNGRSGRGAPEPMRPNPQGSDPGGTTPLEAGADARPQSEPSAARSDAPSQSPDARRAFPPSGSLRDYLRALALKLDEMRRERADPAACAVDVGALRGEIAAMSRSIADLAPRNAVVALEGAIGDLVQRVEMMRQNGDGESLLAPLDAMAAQLSAALKAHDPQAAAAGLEREIRAIGGKIDKLAATAINSETFERIKRQAEEARSLLASAALRTAPLERMERQIGELADRIERLGASPTPRSESAEMARMLADARLAIERSAPAAALQSIERRLEQIAARLDQEISRLSAPAAIDSGPFDELARRIDAVRQSLEARAPAQIDTSLIEKLVRDVDAKLEAAGGKAADAPDLQSMFAGISDKLDRLSGAESGARALEPVLGKLSARLEAAASPVDLRPIEALLHALQAKLEGSAASPVDRRIAEQIADEVGRRLDGLRASQVDAEALAKQIANIYDRIDALAARTARTDESEPAVRELLERLREADSAPRASASDPSAAIQTALIAQLAELRAEQASAERRTQTRLESLQTILETLVQRLASIESELSGDVPGEPRPSARAADPKTTAAFAQPGAEGLGAEASPQRSAQPKEASASDHSSSALAQSGEDFLLEPGAGSPRRGREFAQMIGPKTNALLSAHIAAARRAAQASVADTGVGSAGVAGAKGPGDPEQAGAAVRGVENVRAFYASHKRTVLLSLALVIAATLAVRLAALRAPFPQRPDFPPVKTAKIDAPFEKPPALPGAMKPTGPAIDPSPTASIGTDARLEAPTAPKEAALPPNELVAVIPPEVSQPLRAAVAAGAPQAEYELALRLSEGRGVAKDQQAAALWLERAAALGLAPAQYRLGALYEKGIGVARDPLAAKRWYLKAAEAGNARAAHNLAVMDAEPGVDGPDYVEAAKWFRMAAELGVRDSQYNLAILYARGMGVEQNLRQSWMWFSLAAQQGDADAAKKRDEIAAKMDSASLAAAADALAKFKPIKPDPATNEVAAPPGGWDAKPGSSPVTQSPPALGGARMQAPL